MKHQQIYDEYTRAAAEFATKLAELDEKYGTFLKAEIVDLRILQVGDNPVSWRRTIRINDIVLNLPETL